MKHQYNKSLADLESALLLHRAGRLQEAEAIYKKMPHNPDALHLRGVVAHQLNMNDQAVELINRAIRMQPSNAAYYYSLDTAYRALGRLDEVIAGYQKLLEHTPENAIVWNRLGNAIKDQGMPAEAATCYQNAISLKPDFSEAFSNLGIVFADHGELDSAAECYNQALAHDPTDAAIYANLGIVLRKQRKLDEALDCYRKAIELKPEFAAAHTNLGNVLQERGNPEDALKCFQRATALQPNDAVLLLNLGNGLMELQRLDDAAACFEKAIALKENFPEAYAQLGATFARKNMAAEAATHFLRAIELKPNFPEAFNELGFLFSRDTYGALAQVGFLFSNDTQGVCAPLSRSDQAIVCYRRAIELKPELASAHNNLGYELQILGRLGEAISCYKNAIEHHPDGAAVHSNLIYAMLFSPGHTSHEVFAEQLRFANQFEAPLKPSWPRHSNSRDKDRRLKIGYVSGDFREHAVAYFFEPILACHDKSQVEVFCYYNHIQHDDVTSRIAAQSDHWITCKGWSDDALAARIQQDGIDILVDLSGHTGHNRLLTFARKPAPIQITWIGAPATTGLSAMDYRLTDAVMDPPGMTEQFHTETLLRLPAACQFQPVANRPPVNELPALTQGVFTFACLNNLAKITDEAIALWAQILHALPHARLMLGNVNDVLTQQRLADAFAQCGIAQARLVLHPKLTLPDFLALHQQIDLALDPFPYTGGTTSFHALSMGVPVLTLAGSSPMSRCGAAVMAYAGLPQFITYSKQEYAQRAIEFAGDLHRLNETRQSLAAFFAASAHSGLTKYVRHLEQLYRQAWKKWCDTATRAH